MNQQGVREADFIPIVTWRQTAELCSRYLSKGRKVAVEGVIQVRSYDAQDGSKRYVTEVVADNVEFLSSPQGERPRGDNPPPPSEPSGCTSTPTPLPMWTTSCRSEASAPSFKEENSNV